MIQELMCKISRAETVDEILSYKDEILDSYNALYNKISNQTCSITNFEDIKSLHELEDTMMAYYGFHFYSKCGIPFLKEHNPKTIDIIEFSVLFYSLQVLELLENGFFSEASLCVYDEKSLLDVDVFDHIEKVNLTKYKYKQDLFAALWFYFMCVITIEKKNGREFTFEYDSDIDIFYLTDEKYEEVLDMIYKNYNNSKYSHIVDNILGIYRIRFTKMTYILKFQPLFIEVGYRYLCAIILQ